MARKSRATATKLVEEIPEEIKTETVVDLEAETIEQVEVPIQEQAPAPTESEQLEAAAQAEQSPFETMTSAELIAHFGNKSKAIRGLSAEGWERSKIAKALGVLYQHVRNVLVAPPKKSKS